MVAGHLGYADLDTAMELRTGGLSATCHVSMSPQDTSQHLESLLLSSHCLDRNIGHMFDLWKLIFSDVHWDNNNRLSQLLKLTASEAVNGVAQAGNT